MAELGPSRAKIELAWERKRISRRRLSLWVERSDNRKYVCVRWLKSSPKIVPLKILHQVLRYQYLIFNSSFTNCDNLGYAATPAGMKVSQRYC